MREKGINEEECDIKIQLKIKWNAASEGDMWEDSFSSPPPPVNDIRNASSPAFENSYYYVQCEKKEQKNSRN